MATIDKAALLRPRCPEQDVDLPGVGTVRVRGLTRAEVLDIGRRANDGENTEASALALAMVDPKLTEDEVRQWTEVATFGELEALNHVINKLSGIAGRADKEAYKSLRGES
ncbi:hypothetical protein E1211_15225 [Micromonospora sp. 15K316]|uniref:hypothetical protein n=1 Tax=unclassified Micromonospora TaxID=2617518 RepID=UPI001045AA0C|nr:MULTISPECIES: hypothetical protein [unclassified Micromonospora]TDB71804.1 hypothetical protein E1165_22000 [Micromonospora sp. KC723]TDC35657.1 hypothetical protein E1211_15225 [Micromonospora sp. 15K316]